MADTGKKVIVFKATTFAMVMLIIIISGVSLYMKNINTPEGVIKTALTERELQDKNYILCIRTASTGFDWIMIKDENGSKTYELCNVVGASPFTELNLNADFIFADNTYIFYIVERKTVFSAVTNQDEAEFIAAGWDILYPVKHGFPHFFSSKKYITEKDLK